MYAFLEQYQLNLIFRMLVACICGIAIGFERKNRAKEAGMRTHCIVACASAMMMIISKYGFSDLITETGLAADVRLDPSRMAQGIVTGVGFLGAGIIFVQRGTIKGLTTAAGIWATSGIGMALGAGMYIIGLSTTIVVLLAQIILHSRSSFMVSHKQKALKIYEVEEENFQETITAQLAQLEVSVTDVAIKQNSQGTLDYTFFCEMASTVKEESLIYVFPQRCAIDTAG